MHARLVPSSHGWQWIVEGWKIFRTSPLRWLALVFGYFVFMSLVGLIPLVGVAAAFILVPGISVAFMTSSRVSEHGQPIQITMLFDGFRENLPAQLGLGAVYLVLMSITLFATTLVDDGALVALLLGNAKPTAGEISNEDLRNSFLVVATLYTPIMMMFWFAPTLVAWHSMPIAKALFFSLFACLINWRAFTVYGAVLAILMFGLSFVGLFILILVSGGGIHSGLRQMILPIVLSLLPTLFASFYASYRDIFVREDPAQSA